MRLWRISNHADLRGAGGLRAGGRWHSAGHPIVYCGTSPAACLLEALVHVSVRRPEELPLHYQLLAINLPDEIEAAPPPELPPDWRSNLAATRAAGDAWLRSFASLLLAVPSALVPQTDNVLLNPLHPDASKASIAEIVRHPFDPRLFGE
jgi:RES domain-containing protein